MNDPWNVKAVRRGDLYQSCMRINGIPLLPPVLSTECRKEMQYYKLLAKEVEKRISSLQTFVDDDVDSVVDRTGLPELPDCEKYEANNKQTVIVDNLIVPTSRNKNNASPYSENDTQLFIDLNLKISDRLNSSHSTPRKTLYHNQKTDELPERDCDYKNVKHRRKSQDDKSHRKRLVDDINSFDSDDDDILSSHIDTHTASSKNFTGSLNDIHGESSKESQRSTLTRQRSYTLLNPSPHLLAHLKVESMNTGIDVKSISMSESRSNTSPNSKKRRSWDLETAKVKWSSMALDLRNKFVSKNMNSPANKNSPNITQKSERNVSKSAALEKAHKSNASPYAKTNRSEPLERAKPTANLPSNKQTKKEPASDPDKSPLAAGQSYVILKREDNTPHETTVALISGADSPAARVRELYERLQKQQLMQMASLMEKQKKEQQIMQEVFAEQNNLLLKQLKTVCPKASITVKQAWGEVKDDTERGPVSLSQLINNTSENSIPNSPIVNTLAETSKCITNCDNVLKKSRDLTNSMLRKHPQPNGDAPCDNIVSVQSQKNGNNKRQVSPNARNASRRLNYDTSMSSDYEPMSTDRTNDTMADLNVTFPSDSSEADFSVNTEIQKSHASRKSMSNRRSPVRNAANSRTSDRPIRRVEDEANNSKGSVKHSILQRTPTVHELAAATRIVAYARGYLVRRLMRTERVQGTVQTIKDALLCALQLHQDREGIRGADVDLHRRLIQQITAACYSLHDTFVASSAAERCAMIAADRSRKQALATKQPTPRLSRRNTDIMSQSHTGVFPSRTSRQKPGGLMTQSNYETFSNARPRARLMLSPHNRRPWR